MLKYRPNYSDTTDEVTNLTNNIVNTKKTKSLSIRLNYCCSACSKSTHCVSSVPGNENDNTNTHSNNKICTIKGRKLYVPVVALSTKDNQKVSKLLSKELERSVYWYEYIKKVKTKILQANIDIFLTQTLCELKDCLF